jgi:hypothetical protein
MLAAAPERPLVSTWVVATYNTQMQPPPAVALPTDAIKGKHLLHFRILQRAADGPASGFPQCELLQRAAVERDRGLQGIKTIYQDLCDPDWPRNTREELLHSIEMEKKRMVLTEVPWEPQTIAVRGAFQRLQYGRDYIYESTENEIILVNPGSFRAGDLLEVSYYTGKPPEELPGNPQPGAP